MFKFMTRRSRQLDKIAHVVGGFIAMSRTCANGLVDLDDNATAFLGFAYGAIDAMAHQAGLDLKDSREVLKRYLALTFRGDEQRVTEVLGVLATIHTNEAWAHSIEIGGNAAIQFLRSKDGSVGGIHELRKMLEIGPRK